jgi:hypothetical protein
MSLLSSFVQNQLLKAIETEFAAHAPDIQEAIVAEVQAFANQALQWVESKLNQQPPKG